MFYYLDSENRLISKYMSRFVLGDFAWYNTGIST